MDGGNIDLQCSSGESFSHPPQKTMSYATTPYGIPNDYNPEEQPPVRYRNHNSADISETQRKRRSKNRLSNRRSTGFVNPEMVEEALNIGPSGTDNRESNNNNEN